jgi:uroporphyrinogen decarboxylase
MTSRERVQIAFAHREPDRVPAWCGASPEFLARASRECGLSEDELFVRFGDDFRRVHSVYRGPGHALTDDASMRTLFGIERMGIGYGQPTGHPLAGATMDDVAAYPWPEPDWMDVSGVRGAARAYGGEYAILGGDWSPFWHDAIDLVGMEALYLAMYDSPEVVDAVFGRIVDFYHEVSRRTFEAAGDAIDIFFIGNDFGSQCGPLLGPELFDRFVMPHLKRLIDLGHRYGLPVQLHCCGGFAELMPAMIDAGLDALHAIQPGCAGMDLRELKRRFGSRIVFNGAIDSQSVLIEGTPELVRSETRKVLEIMKSGGGYVGGASHDYILEETPVENVLAMFDAIREYGEY